MKRLNIKLMVWLLVTPAVLAVGIHFLHAFQIERNAGSLKAQAEEAVKAGDTDEAISQYTQYLKHRDDKEAYAELARLADEATKGFEGDRIKMSRAYLIMEEATRRHGDLADVRKRLIDFCMKVGRFRDAMDHIDRLRADGAGDSVDLDVKYAICLSRFGRDEQAVKRLSEVIGYNAAKQEFSAEPARGSKQLEPYEVLSYIYRKRGGNSEDADIVINQMVAANPNTARAYALRGQYLLQKEKFKESDADMNKALELDPKDADIVLMAAEAAILQKDLDRAQKLLVDGVTKHADNWRFYRMLAGIEIQKNAVDNARVYVDTGLQHDPKNQDLLGILAELDFRKQDFDGVRMTIKRMKDASNPGDLQLERVEMFECKLLNAEKKYGQSARQLELLRPRVGTRPAMAFQVDLMLGECYLAQGQPDRAMDAYRRALEVDPTSPYAQAGKAGALRALGKAEEANQIVSQIRSRAEEKQGKPAPPIERGSLQKAVAAQLQKPDAERDWTEVDKLLAVALKESSLTDVQKTVVQAEILINKKDLKQARELLKAAVKAHPKELLVWVGLLNLVDQDKESTFTTDDILQRAEKELGPVIQLKQLALMYALRKPAKEAKEAIKKLEVDLDKASPADRNTLLLTYGSAYYRLRDYENTRRCWWTVSQARPDDTKLLLTLFQLAKEFGAEADMDTTLQEIRKTQFVDSALLKLCEAEKLVWKVRQKKADVSTLAEARQKLNEARKSRPEWHEVARLGGEIGELEGKPDDAIANFRSALELGPSDPNVARHLAVQLYTQGRIAEADEALKYIPNIADADPLKKIQIEKDLRQGKSVDALEDAKRVVDAEPENATNYLWYGQLLSHANRGDEAQAAFRTAVEKDPKSVQGWLLLIRHLAVGKQLVDAQAVIREAQDKVPADGKEAFLAQAYEIARDKKLAEQSYLELLAKKPKDTAVLRAVAAFYLNNNEADKARKQLDAILAQAAADPKAMDVDRANVAWARRAVAQLIYQQGDYLSLKQALKLVQENKVNGKLPPEDMLFAADILAKRPEHASRVEAIGWIEKVQAVRSLTPNEQFVLAELYELTGDWSKARETVVNVLGKVESLPALSGGYARLLLKHEELLEAERWIEKVEKTEPNTPMAQELRARLLAKQGKGAEAAELFAKIVNDVPEKSRLQALVAIGSMLEEYELNAAAEQMLRDASASNPRAKLFLAAFLGRHGNVDEAFALLEESRTSYPLPFVTQTALQVLHQRPTETGKQHFETVAKWLKKAMEEEPKALDPQLQQADLMELQGRANEVISIYRGLLDGPSLDAKQRAIVSNNLSYVLIMNEGAPSAAEALKLINNAIDTLGPSSDLLDTRAMCFLAQGDTKQAISDLRAAIIESPSALKYIHLALAELAAGNNDAAGKTFEKARNAKLDVNALSANERKNYDKLVKELKGN